MTSTQRETDGSLLSDHLVKALLAACERREALGFLAALITAGTAQFLRRLDAGARGNGAGVGGNRHLGKRQAARRRHRKNNRRKQRHRKPCKSTAQICRGRCGLVTTACNHHRKTVDCGSCACDPPCPACHRCDDGTGACQLDPNQQGVTCGETGQVCQADGSCACDSSSCTGTAPICVNGGCVACSGTHKCDHGCCSSDGSCQPGNTREACGLIAEACDVCMGDEVCSGDRQCVVPCGAPGAVCRVFVTSGMRRGNFGGLDGADQFCQELAMDAALPGTYKAWLSDSTGSPSSRFTQARGPYQLINGVTIADNWTDLTGGSLAHEINIDEFGDVLPDSTARNDVWTTTTPGGVRYTIGGLVVDCENWTLADFDHFGALGTSSLADANWSEAGIAITCATRNRLYCFQQS